MCMAVDTLLIPFPQKFPQVFLNAITVLLNKSYQQSLRERFAGFIFIIPIPNLSETCFMLSVWEILPPVETFFPNGRKMLISGN